ncbi:glycosyltransferase family 2 protein [Clostridium perfringens]|uniref:glycosyltransferase family 2 protein n=2 Tax=Clostridium perfringens TaxID=1502 RepID=UPI0024BD1E91|nr:glycosyltransferase family A protein [Clostridium perfringens]EJT6142695.1 glycosyltransferase family 2 protein [Clostridium perfringens]ELC8364562.1 glycosyltransferase family 2 protein [Clostridium perfringens]ELC8365485.1 glycosyltransferase family 2 protein [Clostridium perfringens]
MKSLTVFTPTYNRKTYLYKCYDSLCKQNNKDFEWLIIDDGSTDGTSELVEKWIKSNDEFKIRYIYKENGGLHTAYNVAIENINTELAMCIDSDDYVFDNAIDKILKFWERNRNDNIAGIVGLDCYENGDIIGDLLPKKKSINLIDLLVGKYKINNGDRKIVVRTNLYKSVAPMKSFNNEKNFNPHYMHLLISKQYNFLVFNERLCVVEYQADGMTMNILNQFYNSPRSFLEIRRLYLSFENTSLKFKFKNIIHLISSSILCGEKYWYKEIDNKLLAFLALPFGIFLSQYLRVKCKR